MLYKTLKRQIAKNGLTEELKKKIDVFYLAGRLTDEEYKDLMGIEEEEEEPEEMNFSEADPKAEEDQEA